MSRGIRGVAVLSAVVVVGAMVWVAQAPSSSAASQRAGSSTLEAAPIGGPGPRSGMPWTSGVNGDPVMDAPSVEAFGNWRGKPVDVAVVSTDRTQGFDHMVDPGWIINNFRGWPGKLVIGWTGRQHFRNFTTRLVAGGRAGTVVRFAWEFNGYMYWRATNATQFINCFRRASAALRQGDPTVIIDLTLNGDHTPSDVCGGNAQNCYPGDQYLDIIGIDFYDQWEPKTQQNGNFDSEGNAEAGVLWTKNWARQRGKKFSVTEWSIVNPSTAKQQRDGPHFGLDNPYFIRRMMELFRSSTADLAYEAYFNTADREDVGSDLYRVLGGINSGSAAEYKRQVAMGGTTPPPSSSPPPAGAVLVRGVGSRRCLTPPTTEGNNATIQNCASQRWSFTSGGPVTINGRCLVALGTANFTKVSTGACNGANSQKWTLLADGSIKGTESGRCVDVFNHGTAAGTVIQLWDCTGEPHQRWTLRS